MNVQIDFTLNRRFFGVVELTIFRLVLNGMTSAGQISNLLWIFSDEVIASAIRNLVNGQILCADLDAHTLSLSEPVLATIDVCLNNQYHINMPDTLIDTMSEGSVFIDDLKTKEAIIAHLMLGVNLNFLAKSLDFYIRERGESNE